MYSPQEKKDFALKDAKYSIGMSRGNALAKAVDLVIAKYELSNFGDDDLLDIIEKWANKFHHFNQVSIEKDFAEWKSLNEERLNTELGITEDFQKNVKDVNSPNFYNEGVKL